MGKADRIKIDAMISSDLDQALEIERLSFSRPWSRQLFMDELRRPLVSTLLVALSGDEQARTIVGYMVFWVVAGEMHILNLAVAPQRRRRGTAKALVLSGLRIAHAKGAETAFLEVRRSNIAAQRLYEGLGFAKINVRKNYYDVPVEDAVVMSLDRIRDAEH